MLIRPFWLSLQHDGREEQQQRQEVCAVNATEIWKRTTTPKKTNKQTNKQTNKSKSKREENQNERNARRNQNGGGPGPCVKCCRFLLHLLFHHLLPLRHIVHILSFSLSLSVSLSLSLCVSASLISAQKKKFYLFYFSQTKKNKLYLSTSGRFTGRTSNTRKPEKEFMNRSLLPWNGSWLL